MYRIRFCAILFTIALHRFGICSTEDMKTTLLGSDLYDMNIVDDTIPKQKFRLLSDVNNTLFIGGSNTLQRIFMDKPTNSTPIIHETEFKTCDPNNDIPCERQGDKKACYNYLRVFNVMEGSTMFTCGSNALYPRCYLLNYTLQDDEFKVEPVTDTFNCEDSWSKGENTGVDFTPFNWDNEMVQLFSGNGKVMFSGGSRKLENRDSLICRIHFTDNFPSSRICTAIGSKFLNDASFVGKPIQRNEYTYFFYREFAEEYINHGKIIYSRVGRICSHDEGGVSGSLDGKLISFIKARLDCSISGEYDPFFFNELNDVYQSSTNPDIVYAVFTTPKLGLQQSAVCRYDLSIIEHIMNTKMFRGQASINSLWLPVTDLDHRPGICSSPIPPEGYDRYWAVNLLDPLITNQYEFNGVPTPMFILQNSVYTSIVIEDQLIDAKVYILGTDNSTVFMAYEKEDGEVKIFHKIELKKSDEEPDIVTDLTIRYYEDNTTFVYGTTNGQIFGFQLANCDRYTEIKCTSNPYCNWDLEKLRCASVHEEAKSPAENNENQDFETFTSQAVCDNDTVVLKFAKNSPERCLTGRDEICRFYLMASVKNNYKDLSLGWRITPEDAEVTEQNITGSLFKHYYFTVDVTVNETKTFTFELTSTNCLLNFQVILDESAMYCCDSRSKASCCDSESQKCRDFYDSITVFDNDVEKFRYCMYRWPQDSAEECQYRITRQEKKGVSYFPRSADGPCQDLTVDAR